MARAMSGDGALLLPAHAPDAADHRSPWTGRLLAGALLALACWALLSLVSAPAQATAGTRPDLPTASAAGQTEEPAQETGPDQGSGGPEHQGTDGRQPIGVDPAPEGAEAAEPVEAPVLVLPADVATPAEPPLQPEVPLPAPATDVADAPAAPAAPLSAVTAPVPVAPVVPEPAAKAAAPAAVLDVRTAEPEQPAGGAPLGEPVLSSVPYAPQAELPPAPTPAEPSTPDSGDCHLSGPSAQPGALSNPVEPVPLPDSSLHLHPLRTGDVVGAAADPGSKPD